MNFIVLVREISARQWLGRLLNEAGLCREGMASADSHSVEFVQSIGEALVTAESRSPVPSFMIVWDSAVTVDELPQLLTVNRDSLILMN